MQRTSGVCFGTETFGNMKRLRLLKLDNVQVAGDYGHLPKQLRWVDWKAFSLTHIPENFYQENIVAIDLKYSYLKLVWKVPQVYVYSIYYRIFSRRKYQFGPKLTWSFTIIIVLQSNLVFYFGNLLFITCITDYLSETANLNEEQQQMYL